MALPSLVNVAGRPMVGVMAPTEQADLSGRPTDARSSVPAALGRPSQPSRRIRMVLAVAVGAVTTVTAFGPINDTTAGAGMLTLLAVLTVGWRTVRRRPGVAAGWKLVLAGASFAASGVVTFLVRTVVDSHLAELAGHVVLFVAYLTLAAGLLRLARPAGEHPRVDLDAAIDMAIVAILAALLIWQFVGRYALAADRLGDLMLPVTVGHSVIVVVLLTLTTRVLIRGPGAQDTWLLAAGTACLTVSNLAYLGHVDPDDLGSWAATAWLAGLLLIGLAVVNAAPREPTPAGSSTLLPLGRVALSLAPIPIPVLVALFSGLPSQPHDRWTFAVTTTLLASLALLRASRLLQSARDAWDHLAARERLFQVLATNSSDAVLRVDRNGCARDETLTVPASMDTGEARDADGRRGDIAIDVRALDGEGYKALLTRAMAVPGSPASAELQVLDRFGSPVWVAARAVDLLEDPAVGAIVINLHDITERKRAEAELTHQALHDSLTGLPNRGLFRDRLEHALARRSRQDTQAAVLYIDLDGFKSVNDGLGHEAGDRLLRQAADRLAATVRTGETVARLGGDEFAILMESSGTADDDAVRAAERIVVALREPFDLDGRIVSISASIGIALSGSRSTATGLLRNADVAMYEAKAAGRGRWLVYEPTLDRSSGDGLQLESELVGALARGEFELYYQPIVDLGSDRTIGFEALLRWIHPDHGVVAPDRFIPLLERSTAIVDVGTWVLQEACRTLAGWQVLYGEDLTISVNLSGRQLERGDLATIVAEQLAAAGLHPGALMLEITETILIDHQSAADQLEQLHALGVRVAIDDFGTGYSALAYLRRFPVDTIKIDRSFVSTIEAPALPPLVRGLIDLARTLEVTTIAEGIEEEIQRDLLREHGCGLGQGYLYARPMPGKLAEEHLQRQLEAVASPLLTGHTPGRWANG